MNKHIWPVLLGAAIIGTATTGTSCVGTIGHGDGDGTEASGPEGENDSGTVAMHRLNRVEYANTIHDLLGTDLTPSENFPADDISFGFDNIAKVQTLAPLQFELYEQAASLLAAEVMAIPSETVSTHFEAEELTGDNGSANGGFWALVSNGAVGGPVDINSDGEYIVRARVYGQQAGPDVVRAALLVGGVTLQEFDVPAEQDAPQIIEVTASLTAGNKQVAVAFLNDFYQPPQDSNLYVDWVELEGPLGSVGNNPLRERLIDCDTATEQCRRDVLTDIASRAFRRPASPEEIGRLEGLVDVALAEGDSADVGLELALRAILISPHFLFRPELDEDPDAEVSHPLNDYEVASRLSYFLWSTMPDDELFRAAAAGELTGEDNMIGAQVDRMLAHDKAKALVDNFAGQWLLVRALDDHVPDYEAFPSYDEELETAFRTEIEMFFGEFLEGGLGMNELLSANFTYVNSRLADHYGLDPVTGSAFQRVSLENNPERLGLLTMGSLLTVTSYPTRTSPVKRGVWILEQLLCDGPPPPPPGVEDLAEVDLPNATLRERLAAHRENPSCAVCHNLMDPLGLALENYNGVGAFRTMDNGSAIDASGELDGGQAFDDGAGMVALLEQDERFSTCLVEKLLVYGLGRGVGADDHHYIDAMVGAATEAGFRLPDVIKSVVTNELFLTRRGTKEGN